MNDYTNFNPNREKTGRFAAGAQSTPELAELTRTVYDTDAEDAERFQILALDYEEGQPGADPEFWRRLEIVENLFAAPPERPLNAEEQRGWNSVESLSELTSRPLHECRDAFDYNKCLAQNTTEIYRIAGWGQNKPSPGDYWDGRAERLAAIVEGIDQMHVFA